MSQNPPLYYYTQIVNYGDPLTTIENSVSTLTFSPNLINSVHAWTNMAIAWQMYIGPNVPSDNSAGWATFNTSHNDNFITLAKSTADKLFLSLAYHGTVSAEGMTTINDTMDAMWQSSSTSAIANRQITRKEDGKPLYYYGNWNTNVTSLPNLLLSTSMTGGAGDGQCRSWAQFWNQELAIHGISSEVKTIVPKGNDTGFFVKNWSITQNYNITYNGIDYESINGVGSPPIVNNAYNFVNAPGKNSLGFTDDTGNAGQNNGNPQSLFLNHVIVKYMYTDNGITHPIYYDPSYGKKYTSLLAFDISALSGYYADIGGTLYFARKNDVDKLTVEVKEVP